MNRKSKTFLIVTTICLVMVRSLDASTLHFISGVVTDNRSNPLYGANVVLQNTFQGSTTDSLGFYKIENLDVGKYTIMVSYIGYKTKKLGVYISEFDADDDTNISSSFSSKLQLLDDEDIQDNENILKASFHENIDFILELDALETDQIVVSASKKKEKVIDAPITIAAVSNQSIRRSISGDIGNVLKTVEVLRSIKLAWEEQQLMFEVLCQHSMEGLFH